MFIATLTRARRLGSAMTSRPNCLQRTREASFDKSTNRPRSLRTCIGNYRTLAVAIARAIDQSADLAVLVADVMIHAFRVPRQIPFDVFSRTDPSQFASIEEFPELFLMPKANDRIQKWPPRDTDTLKQQRLARSPVTSYIPDDFNIPLHVACSGDAAPLKEQFPKNGGLH